MPLTSSKPTAFNSLKAVFFVAAASAGIAVAPASASDFRLNLSLDYGSSNDPLVIKGARTSFGFGALIPELVYSAGWLGSFGVGYGYGYGPGQEATLGPVSGKGDLESDVIQFTYSNHFNLTDTVSLMVMYENRQYEVSGSMTGQFGSQTAPISVKSDIEFEELGARLAYSWREDLRLFAGVSTLDWTVDSDAKATVGETITARVNVAGGDTSLQYSLGADTVVWDRPVRFEVRAADLEADETVSKVEIRLTTTLYNF